MSDEQHYGEQTPRDAIWIATCELLCETGVFRRDDLDHRLTTHHDDGKIDSIPQRDTQFAGLTALEEAGFITKQSKHSSVHRVGPEASTILSLSPRARILTHLKYQPYLCEMDNEDLQDFFEDQSDDALESIIIHDDFTPNDIHDIAYYLE